MVSEDFFDLDLVVLGEIALILFAQPRELKMMESKPKICKRRAEMTLSESKTIRFHISSGFGKGYLY